MARLFVLSVSEMNPTASDFIRWGNDNSGFVSIILFVATLVVAWAGGLFKLLRHKLRFVLSLSAGPTFACTYLTAVKFGEYDVRWTFFALYLTFWHRGD